MVSGAIKIGGFANGFAGGFAGGFVNGFGNSLLEGENFGQALGNGLRDGVIGGITAGTIRGISDVSKGYSFWDGSQINEITIGRTTKASGAMKTARGYNSSEQANINDEILKSRVEQEYRITEGSLKINKITTKTGKYGLDASGYYVDKSGEGVGGYVRRYRSGWSNMHISPKYALGDVTSFRAVVGHELMHTYHSSVLGSSFNRVLSEKVAYRYTANTYFAAGQFNKALSTIHTARMNGFWGTVPVQYTVPSFYKFFAF